MKTVGDDMNKQALLERVTVNPDVMVGKPTVRGMRITVEQLLKAMAAGVTVPQLLEDHPELVQEDIQAVLLYAAELVEGTTVFAVSD
jgi:uncharacterized protein (DUF433 family)